MTPPDLDRLNQREYRKLLVSIKASAQQLDLLLAICDDRNLQAQLIENYEAELNQAGITPLRARLDPKQPSLRATLEAMVAREPALRDGTAMVTIVNASELLGVRLNQEQSEQERFFFSLQWTREALRQFEFPIVLWLADSIATRLSRAAPDFWSWRSGVFEFVAESVVAAGQEGQLPQMQETDRADRKGQLSIEELQQQIADIESDSPLLITLYNDLGKAWESEYDYSMALEQYEKALGLAKRKKDVSGQARSLRNLGDSLRHCGRPFQSLDYYQQALVLYRELGDPQGEANSLDNLGNAYQSLGQYQQAIDFHQQSLEIAREIGESKGKANSLNNLGNVYYSLGQYRQAIDFHQQSLEITRDWRLWGGKQSGVPTFLGSISRPSISISNPSKSREIGDRQGEATSLGNLGNAYNSLGQYQQAIDFHQQSLEIAWEIGDRQGEGNLTRQSRECLPFPGAVSAGHRLLSAIPRNRAGDWRSPRGS